MISMIDELRAVLDALEHVEHLGLDRHVERGRRLVGDQHVGVVRDRHRDHRPLAHAAGVLVRVLVDALARVRDADEVEQLDRPARRSSSLRQVVVHRDRLGDLVADREAPGSARRARPGRSSRSRSPRIGCSCFSDRPSRFSPRNSDLAGDLRRSSGSRPRIAIDVTLLPEPDSPTMPSVSLRVDVEAHVVDRVHDAVVGRELDA